MFSKVKPKFHYPGPMFLKNAMSGFFAPIVLKAEVISFDDKALNFSPGLGNYFRLVFLDTIYIFDTRIEISDFQKTIGFIQYDEN